MSTQHSPPRQDRRGVGRSPVKKHQEHSVGTKQIDDPENGSTFSGIAGSGGAPGANRTEPIDD